MLRPIALATIAFLGAQQVAPLALLHLPTTWGYAMADSCSWRPRPWARALGPNTPGAVPDRAGRRLEWRCLHRKGLKSLVIFGAHVEQRWPEPATIARWEAEDENRDPPHPDWALSLPSTP